MKFNTINALDSALECLVRSRVKHYYTDWKNHDRPKYMGYKGSMRPGDKELLLIVHPCGTYLFPIDRAKDRKTPENTICSYYMEQERDSSEFFNINLHTLTIRKEPIWNTNT